MKTKLQSHTPGPWKCYSKGITEKFGNTGEDFSIQYSDGSLASHIAEISFMGLCEEHGEAKSNANLIAAAPEILEALKDLVNNYLEYCNEDDFSEKAFKAIAKAEGREV